MLCEEFLDVALQSKNGSGKGFSIKRCVFMGARLSRLCSQVTVVALRQVQVQVLVVVVVLRSGRAAPEARGHRHRILERDPLHVGAAQGPAPRPVELLLRLAA